MNWIAKEGYDMYMEYPRSTCKDKTVKGQVSCCGNIKQCDKKLSKDKKEKGESGSDSKLALEIKKVKNKQKVNNKNKGENNEN